LVQKLYSICKARKNKYFHVFSHCFWSILTKRISQKFTQIGGFCRIVESLKTLSYLDFVFGMFYEPASAVKKILPFSNILLQADVASKISMRRFEGIIP
jgi:hypothetical protein